MRKGKTMQARIIAVAATAVVCVSLVSVASGNVCNMGPGLTSLETVHVGNPGNAADTTGYGAVACEYNIGKYEVTAGQYTEFLNAVAATDTYGLYSTSMDISSYGCQIQRSGSSGSYTYSIAGDWANRPVNYVTWGDAVRFANWLHNGQPMGSQDLTTTEDGAYYLNGATSDAALMAVSREANWKWAITSEDEWYKAAYYDGSASGYFDYPTGTNSRPSNDLIALDPGNNANFRIENDYTLGSPYWRTEVGEFKNSDSPYGTLDQGGNVWEWTEEVIDLYRCMRGGSRLTASDYLQASERSFKYPTSVGSSGDIGFRVVRIPEPATMAILALGGLALIRRPQRHCKKECRQPATHAPTKTAGLALILAFLCLACHGQANAGEIVSWGSDVSGEVTDTPSGNNFVAIAAGGGHSLALRAGGTIVAWGYDSCGQVSNAPDGTGFTAIAGGYYHSLALRSDGSIVSWGDDREGQVSGTPSGNDFVAIAAGSSHSLALKSDGSIISWGHDNWSQVADTPSAVGFLAIDGGSTFSLAIRADGSLESWGRDNDFGQISDTPTGTGFVKVASRGYHSLALGSDGTIVAWGYDADGQVSGTPTSSDFVSIAAGFDHSLALQSDGTIAAWGADTSGQVSDTPVGQGYLAIAAGNTHSLALIPEPATLSLLATGGIALLRRRSAPVVRRSTK